MLGMRRTICVALLVPTMLWPVGGSAQQDSSPEGRLREALRRSTVELRALQDQQATMQANLDQAQQQRDALQKQVDALTAKLAQPPPPDPELPRLQAEVQALHDQNAALQAALQKLQRAYQDAATAARANQAAAEQFRQQNRISEAKLGIATAENGKLVGIANDILHLYRTQGFRSILLGGYEPLLGLKQVELQNMVQDYRIASSRKNITATSPLPGAGIRRQQPPARALRCVRFGLRQCALAALLIGAQAPAPDAVMAQSGGI